MRVILHIWRQRSARDRGRFERFEVKDVSADSSLLEVLDTLNEELVTAGREPVAFDSDCREGICGTCGFVVDGVPHGAQPQSAVCQLHMRHFRDGQEIWCEPFRARAFPLVRDLAVDRVALDRVIAAGGYVSVPTGSAPEANSILVPKAEALSAMDAAACIGCGACVAACPNASAALFTGAKIAHLARLPQGQPERAERALGMVEAARAAGFGHCTNIGECEAVCPAAIRLDVIATMNRDFLRARWRR